MSKNSRARRRPSRQRKKHKTSQQSRRQRKKRKTSYRQQDNKGISSPVHQDETREVHETVVVENTLPRTFPSSNSVLIIGGCSIFIAGVLVYRFFCDFLKHKK